MTTHKLHALIGRTGRYTIGSLSIGVELTDFRENFGRVDVQIEAAHPDADHDMSWVSLDSLTLDEKEAPS